MHAFSFTYSPVVSSTFPLPLTCPQTQLPCQVVHCATVESHCPCLPSGLLMSPSCLDFSSACSHFESICFHWLPACLSAVSSLNRDQETLEGKFWNLSTRFTAAGELGSKAITNNVCLKEQYLKFRGIYWQYMTDIEHNVRIYVFFSLWAAENKIYCVA